MAKDNKQDHSVIVSEQNQKQEYHKPQKWSIIFLSTYFDWGPFN